MYIHIYVHLKLLIYCSLPHLLFGNHKFILYTCSVCFYFLNKFLCIIFKNYIPHMSDICLCLTSLNMKISRMSIVSTFSQHNFRSPSCGNQSREDIKGIQVEKEVKRTVCRWHDTITSWQINGEAMETVRDFIFYFFWPPKSLQMVTAAMKLKDACSLEEKLWST